MVLRLKNRPAGKIMLVLSRKKDEVIIIGDDIEITVVDIRGDQIKIGVSAPKSVSIHRKEVYDAIQNENKAAAESSNIQMTHLAGILRRRQSPPSSNSGTENQ
jgi:carbon storage regulator